MIYRNLGNTGLKVSVYSFGNWVNGDKKSDQDNQIELFKTAYEAGINFFDTAEYYGYGEGERQLGEAIKSIGCSREDLVISTKIYWGTSDVEKHVNSNGLSRKHLIEGIQSSLNRLQLNYVDIIYCHRPDYEVSIESVCRTMSWIIDQGYAHYWGTSEWSAAYIGIAIVTCEKLGLHKPTVEQPQYNILFREKFEKEYRDIFELYPYGSTVWSPLASGFLSGKYNKEQKPDGSRLVSTEWKIFYEGISKSVPDMFSKLEQLEKLAEELGYTQAQLALAWVAANTDVTTCILGARNKKQLLENLKALELLKKWTPEIEQSVNNIFKNNMSPEIDFKKGVPDFKFRKNRRDIVLYKTN